VTVTELHQIFKVLGKCIWYSQRAPEYALAFRKLMSCVVDQAVSGLPADSETIVSFLTPLTTTIDGAIRSLDAQPAVAVKNGAAYLQRSAAVQLGLTAGASLTAIGTALNAEMLALSESVAQKGAGTPPANATGIAWFFEKNYGIVLRQSVTPTIPDAWIDDDVIPD
jgi:hypothetical protein